MAYFTGKDVDVWITTEHYNDCVAVVDNEIQVDSSQGTLTAARANKPSNAIFSGALGNAGSANNRLTDITGCDLSVGATDEDLNFFGLRNVGKIEIKKDTSLTITRKKSDNKNMVLFQGSTSTSATHSNTGGGHSGRWGLIKKTSGTATVVADGSVDPKSTLDDTSTQSYGYRVFLELKGTTDDTGTVLIIPNCTLMDYSGSISNESANEESFTLTSMVKPILMNDTRTGDYFGHTSSGTVALAVTKTAAADM
tara:strand:+ start:63 stop:821 length:759 start_codon:yes stop_codon:yes gene_type:complete